MGGGGGAVATLAQNSGKCKSQKFCRSLACKFKIQDYIIVSKILETYVPKFSSKGRGEEKIFHRSFWAKNMSPVKILRTYAYDGNSSNDHFD